MDNAEIYYDKKQRVAPFRATDSGHMRQLQHLYDFVTVRTAFQDMNPSQTLVSAPNLCLANPGQEYIVYAPSGGEVSLDLAKASGSFSVGWLDPRTGAYEGRAWVSGGAKRTFSSPDANDWVLHLKTVDTGSRADWQERLERAARSPESWRVRREEIRRQILVAAGLWPEFERPPVKSVVTGQNEREGYTLKVDDRIACAAPVCMMAAEFQGGCSCENAPGLRIGLNNVEIAAATAPRPLLVVAATGDWTAHTPVLEGPAILAAYEALGVADRFRCVQFVAPHNYNRDSREAVYAWFARWLQHAPDARRLAEPPLEAEPRENLLVFPSSHPRPEGSLDAAGLAARLKETIRQQLDSLWPHDAASLKRFRETMLPAMRYTLAVSLPGPESIEATAAETGQAGAFVKISLRQHSLPGSLELLGSTPAGERRATLLVLPPGQEIPALADGLRERRQAVFVLRLQPHERETISHGTKKQRSDFESTYYRSALAWQVQDVVTAMAYVTGRAGLGDVRLVGLGDAGIPTLLARALDPTGKASLTIVDLAGLKDSDEQTWTGPLTHPGMLRFGGLPAAAILAAPGKLILHNTRGRLDVAAIRAAYRAAGRESALEVSEGAFSGGQILDCLGRL